MSSARVGPSRAWYLLAFFLPVAGIVGGISHCVGSMSRLQHDLQRISTPGRHELMLESGQHTVFVEDPGIQNMPGPQARLALEHMQLRVSTAADESVQATVRPSRGRQTYNMMGHEGLAVWSVDIPHAGTWAFDFGYPRDVDPPRGIQATVTSGFVGGLLSGVLGTLGLCLGGVLLGLLLFIVVLVLRISAEKRLVREQLGA